ncbi:hypothetical protein AVO41_01275 [Thiomicrospira sp. WB1]|nr:hypothetical protein AVO41_01275 [Thiomicrospira sp. WB1]
MDGFEWKRQKWPWYAKAWLKLNEQLAMRTATHLIADHPGIENYLKRFVSPDKVSMIAYGAEAPKKQPSLAHLKSFGLEPNRYFLIIARAEPENNLHTLLNAYCQTDQSVPLVVVGDYTKSEYAIRLRANACKSIIFTGGIYDSETIQALRYHALAYLHGHSVGGTNPSLIESMACANLILAHKNQFNQGVLEQSGLYFHDEPSCRRQLVAIQEQSKSSKLSALKQHAFERFQAHYQWPVILDAYKQLLEHTV